MTLTEVQNSLIYHFTEHDSFIMDRDEDTITLYSRKNESNDDIDDIKSVKRELLHLSLEELVKQNLICRVKDGYYVLAEPFDNIMQNVPISGETAIELASLLNSVELQECDEEVVDTSCNIIEITEDDIVNLIYLCHELLGA